MKAIRLELSVNNKLKLSLDGDCVEDSFNCLENIKWHSTYSPASELDRTSVKLGDYSLLSQYIQVNDFAVKNKLGNYKINTIIGSERE